MKGSYIKRILKIHLLEDLWKHCSFQESNIKKGEYKIRRIQKNYELFICWHYYKRYKIKAWNQNQKLDENELDHRVEEYHKLGKGGTTVKPNTDEGIDYDRTSKIAELSSPLGASFLGSSKTMSLLRVIKGGIEVIVFITWIQIQYIQRKNIGIG